MMVSEFGHFAKRVEMDAGGIGLVRRLENEFHADDAGPQQRAPTSNSLKFVA
ncbi:msl8590 [Mesorhizobium japonicum MAFF 303099]|uniref:Msl8590 protein n=1 Tax=Mesorhizobium japonicum (strain LMG 29417 / CECT 9101 / MAFF 303099) TaxID=266835 RepID=Q98MH3_RHILO|nr:msl8590 [Mesorhizobium japonicum MAFF 303099]